MNFLLDVNVGSTIAHALIAQGHDIVRTALTDPTATDAALLVRSVYEARIFVTYDRDISELFFRHSAEPAPAVIYIRIEPDDVADVIPRLLPLLDFSFLNGHMTVIGREHTRRRPFPAKSNDNA